MEVNGCIREPVLYWEKSPRHEPDKGVGIPQCWRVHGEKENISCSSTYRTSRNSFLEQLSYTSSLRILPKQDILSLLNRISQVLKRHISVAQFYVVQTVPVFFVALFRTSDPTVNTVGSSSTPVFLEGEN
jgi:hypothetical protein